MPTPIHCRRFTVVLAIQLRGLSSHHVKTYAKAESFDCSTLSVNYCKYQHNSCSRARKVYRDIQLFGKGDRSTG
jgi:hypothetical protein